MRQLRRRSSRYDRRWDQPPNGGGNYYSFTLAPRAVQSVPGVLNEMISDPDEAKSGRVMGALLKMKKLDIAELKHAYEAAGGSARRGVR